MSPTKRVTAATITAAQLEELHAAAPSNSAVYHATAAALGWWGACLTVDRARDRCAAEWNRRKERGAA